MRQAFVPLAFGLCVEALVARSDQQCVQLQASGGASGILGQLSDGQNRIGGGHPTGCYCLSNGGFTDSNGRGCILTPPTTQFQCDTGASPTSGFTIGSSGSVSYNGNAQFYACPVNDNGEYNVYSQPVAGQTKCVKISLGSAGSCGKSAVSSKANSAPVPTPMQPSQSKMPSPKPSQPAPMPSAPQPSKPAPMPSAPQPSQPAPMPSAPQPSKPAPMPSAPQSSKAAPMPSPPASSQPQQPAPSKPANACPADLNGNYQYPHLIVPVSSQQPNQAYGTSYFGTVNSTTCSIFNFDIPTSYSGKECTLVFLFPQQKDLQTSSFTTSGSGNVQFTKLNSAATQQTTYANQPAKGAQLSDMSIAPGNQYVVASGKCAAGTTVSYQMCSTGNYALRYFQDYNPSPIGLYIRQC